MEKIKLLLHEELIKESDNFLIESFESLSNISNKELFEMQLTETIFNLLEMGYMPEEINIIAEQQSQQTNSLWGGLKSSDGTLNIWNTILGGGKSMFKEQIMKYILTKILGWKEINAQSLSIFMSEVNVLDLLKGFKNVQYCNSVMPDIARAIVEIYVNNSQFNGNDQNILSASGASKVGVRNIFMDAIQKSNLDDILGQKICGYIWGIKS